MSMISEIALASLLLTLLTICFLSYVIPIAMEHNAIMKNKLDITPIGSENITLSPKRADNAIYSIQQALLKHTDATRKMRLETTWMSLCMIPSFICGTKMQTAVDDNSTIWPYTLFAISVCLALYFFYRYIRLFFVFFTIFNYQHWRGIMTPIKAVLNNHKFGDGIMLKEYDVLCFIANKS